MQNFGPLEEKALCELEFRLGVALPNRYRDFLKETGGGVVKHDGSNMVMIPSNNKVIAVDVFFGYGVSQNSDILFWNNKYEDELFENVVLIGFDTRQGFLFLIATEDNPSVYYWDDGYAFEESDDDQNIYELGGGLSILPGV